MNMEPITVIANEIQSEGYSIVRKVLTSQCIDQIFSDINSIFDISLQSAGINVPTAESIDAKYLALKNSVPNLKSHAYDLLGRLNTIQEAVWRSRISRVGREIYKMPLLIGPVQVRIDDGSDDRLLPMHQELEQLSLLTVNLWMPLKDVGPGKGGLRIIKGSHKHGLRKHQVCPESGGYYLPENLDYVAGDIITLELGAGDALMFHPFLIHGSEINKSREVRWTIAARLSETTTCPFLRSEHASLYMERNPDPKSPGNEFVSQYLNKD